jgi:polyphenol oxidase
MNWTIDQQQFGVFLTNRNNGVSYPPYQSNNLALHVGDDPNNVLENREQLAKNNGLNLSDLIFMNQVHGTIVETVGIDSMQPLTCDAMITNIKNKALMVMVADCVPILFADTQHKVVAAAHAGWKGTVGEIAMMVVNRMISDYGCKIDTIKVWQGPCIRSCCYTVGKEVKDACRIDVDEYKIMRKVNDDYYFDMQEYNKQLLLKMGILQHNITINKTCVACNVSEYFSYRAENSTTGRFAAGIWIK